MSGRGLPHQWCQVPWSEWPGFASPVVRASITRLDSRIAELEDKADLSAEDRLAAQHLLQR